MVNMIVQMVIHPTKKIVMWTAQKLNANPDSLHARMVHIAFRPPGNGEAINIVFVF